MLANSFLLNKRTVSIIIVTGILIGVLFSAMSFIQSQTEEQINKSLLENEKIYHQDSVKRISSHISSDLQLISDNVATAVNSYAELDLESTSILENQQKLYESLNNRTTVNWIFILDSSGILRVVSSTAGTSLSDGTTDLSFRDYFTITKSTLRPYYTGGFTGINDDQLFIYAYPILDQSGNFKGMMGISFKTLEFFSQYGNIGDPTSRYLSFVGNDEKFIVHPNLEFVSKSVDEIDSVYILENNLTFSSLLSNNLSGIQQINSIELISTGDRIILENEPQFYVIQSTPLDSIYLHTTEIIEQQKLSTFLLILSLTAATGFVIFFFERFKIKEAEQKDSKLIAIGELSARLAHDLRNPLSIIRITLENLKMLYGADETKQRQFEKIDRAIDRIVHQIDEVLGFVRESPMNFQKESVLNILKDVKDSLRLPQDISLVLPKKDASISCDRGQLIVALNNLIYNSVQAIQGKGLIAVSMIENNKKIVLEIEDSGTGIPEDILPKIFEPLFTTKQQGTGLGLVSVKSIIESHGGTISVTSPPTIFTIVLPKNH